MGAFFETISPSLAEWILKQKMFTVATAPLHNQGHVNCSPKGGDYFGIIDERTFWYMELTGSGSETVAHLYEPGNGRITVMFMAFEGPPRILRLYGKGRCLENGTTEFDSFVAKHNPTIIPGTRSIILVDVHQVGTSCGFSVPYYDFKAHRPILNEFFEKKAAKFDAGNENESMPRYDCELVEEVKLTVDRYWALKNTWSNDGLPSYKIAQKTAQNENITPLKKFVGAYAQPCYSEGRKNTFTMQQVVLVAFVSAALAVALLKYLPGLVDSRILLYHSILR